MDKKIETAQVPDFQLAKVGERKRRKGAGVPFFGGSGAASHSGGGILGSVSGLLGQSALKVGVTLLAGALGVGAYTVGKNLRPDASQFERKPALFASKNEKPKYSASDLANLPGGESSRQSSIGMVTGTRDGLTPEERAAKEAKAAADAKAAAEAQAKADAEAKAKESASVPGVGTPDPAALAAAQAAAAAAAKEKDAAFSRKFGDLSKGSSGLGGGGGLSSGIGQSFAPLSAKNTGFGGAMSAGGNRKAGTGTSSAVISSGRNPGRSLAQRSLNTAARMASQSRAGALETQSAKMSVPFDTGKASDQLLSGAGGATGAGPASGKADTNPPATGGSGGSPVGVGGGSDSTTPDDCPALAAEYGWQGEFVNSSSGGCVKNVEGTGKDDPTNWIFDLVKTLFKWACILSGIQLIITALLALEWIPGAQWIYTLYNMLGYILTGIGALIGILGLMLVGMGRGEVGVIYTVAGALIAGLAYEGAANTSTIVENAALPIMTELISLLEKPLTKGKTDPRTWNSDTNQWT